MAEADDSLELAILLSLEANSDEVLSVSFSPDGATLTSAGADATVRPWESTLASADFSAWRKRLCGFVRPNFTAA